MKRKLTILTILFLMSGCSSLVTHTSSNDQLGKYLKQDLSNVSKSYSGLCFGIVLIVNNERGNTKSEIISAIGFYDMPASAAIDTLFLPIDLSLDFYFYIKNGYYPSTLCSKVK